MRHFEQAELANRYANYRPQVQTYIIDSIAQELDWAKEPKQFANALDVACGTGHSTKPLLEYATSVKGCDVSETMIQEAKLAVVGIDFCISNAEALPSEDGSLDLVSVGFAYHWFDQISFLKEVARALNPTGLLLIYNMRFTGNMLSNPTYQDWHKNSYLNRYPSPKRKLTPLKESLAQANCGLVIDKVLPLTHPLNFTKLTLRNYLTTQSNIAVALDNGESLQDIDSWLNSGISEYFQRETESFEYIGQAITLRQTS